MRRKTIFENGDYRCNFPSALHLATDSDYLRPVFQYINFTGGFAYAMDAHIIVRQSFRFINIEGIEKLEGKSIHQNIFRRIYADRKTSIIRVTDVGIEVENFVIGQKITYSVKNSTEIGKVPNYEGIINAETLKGEHTVNYNQFGLNPRIFNRLINAMAIEPSTMNVRILMPPTNSMAFLVFDENDENAGAGNQLGLIMPVMLADQIKY